MATNNYLALIARHRALRDFTTARVRFTSGGQKSYVYLVPRSWKVVAGDQLFVLVSGVTPNLVHVDKVDSVPQLDADVMYAYRWAAAKFDRTAYDLLNSDTSTAEYAVDVAKRNWLIDQATSTYKRAVKPVVAAKKSVRKRRT